MTTFAENRKARYDYEILEKYEAGLVLSGQEVKSIRNSGANLVGSHISIEKGELWLKGAHIAPYSKAGRLEGYQPDAPRKVLMRKRETQGIFGKMQQKGLTLIPLSLYAHGRHIKLQFALCRGRKAHSKKEQIKQRDINREILRGDDEH